MSNTSSHAWRPAGLLLCFAFMAVGCLACGAYVLLFAEWPVSAVAGIPLTVFGLIFTLGVADGARRG